MTIAENTDAIREWTDKLKSAGNNDEKLRCAEELNSLWLDRSILFDKYTGDGREHYRGYASGMAEGYRIMLYMLRDELEDM